MNTTEDHASGMQRLGRIAQAVAIALSWVAAGAAHAAETAAEPAAATEAPAVVSAAASAAAADRRHDAGGATRLDSRVKLMAKELDLSAAQQAQVKKVLLEQREQVAALWNDASVPAAIRVSRTQAVGDHTADRIRALLTEKQRKKYIQPRQHDAKVGAAAVDVESWMNKGNQK